MDLFVLRAKWCGATWKRILPLSFRHKLKLKIKNNLTKCVLSLIQPLLLMISFQKASPILSNFHKSLTSTQKMCSDKLASKSLIKESSIVLKILAKMKFQKLAFLFGEDMKSMSSWLLTNYSLEQMSAREFWENRVFSKQWKIQAGSKIKITLIHISKTYQ